MAIKRKTGEYHIESSYGEEIKYFMPYPLPPNPPIELSPQIEILREEANRALGRLDGITDILPDKTLFLYFYVRKEAVLSSQIEGTQSTFSDLLLFELDEIDSEKMIAANEVSNYVAAMNHGLDRLNNGFPLSLRLLKEIHGILLQSGRDSDKSPGEFRTSPNWIGGTRPGNAHYVPPRPEEMTIALGDMEKFLHSHTPLLLKAALTHVQFESIHPFLDGNGRIGRLLITFLLCADGALGDPLLYLSLYLKTHREIYYDLLQRVRTEGAWEDWLEFFFQGVRDTSLQATDTARAIQTLFKKDQEKIQNLGRVSASLNRIHSYLQKSPIISATGSANKINLSKPTVHTGINTLVDMGILKELTGKSRNRLFAYHAYLSILNEGTEQDP